MAFPTLDRMVGHEGVLAILRQSIVRDSTGHAYLFYGPPGVGKATMAWAFVQAMVCSKRVGTAAVSGCGACSACLKVARNIHCDVVSVGISEGKTLIGVDQIRELASFFSLTPMESSWKAAILDDAADMHESAANALLKTLEEPPAGSLLILVTHRMGRVLPTLRSRCQKIRFSSLTTSDLRRVLAPLISLDDAHVTELLALGRGDVGRIVAFSEGDFPHVHHAFHQAMARLPTVTLGQLSRWAEEWGQPGRFASVVVLLRAWFRVQMHAAVAGHAVIDGTTWLETMTWSEQLFSKSAQVNVNRRLTLEAVLIRLARMHGASY